MSVTRWDPWSEMMSLRDAMDRLLEESFVHPRRGADAETLVDVRDTGDDYVVRATLPGIRPEDVHIQVTGNTLHIRGETTEETPDAERGRWIVRERRTGRFERTVTLPRTVMADQADAEFENGVLTVRLPKTEEARVRSIPIRAGSQTAPGRIPSGAATPQSTSGMGTMGSAGGVGTSPGGMMAGSMADVRPGMPVVAADGATIGQVKETTGDKLLVDRPMQRDIHVPHSAVREVTTDRIMLNVPSNQIDQMAGEPPVI